MKTNLRRRSRGYILVESMVASALLVVGLGSLMNSLERARDMTTQAARNTVAKQLLVQGMEQARVLGYAGVATTVVEHPVAGVTHPYRRTLTPVGSGSETLAGSTPRAYRDVAVQVTFQANGQTRTQTATVRVYQ